VNPPATDAKLTARARKPYPVTFPDDTKAQEKFLQQVEDDPNIGIKPAIEPLGYTRRDVKDLLAADKTFLARYEEARQYDADTIRTELARRAHGGSDRLLEFVARLRLPEARELAKLRVEGRIEHQAVPYLDYSKLDDHDLDELRRILEKGRPDPEVLPKGGRAALELLPGG
jgi:hypothetical protein